MFIYSCIKFMRNNSIYPSWSFWSCMSLNIMMNTLSVPYGIEYLRTVRQVSCVRSNAWLPFY
jgi:hypothetical protein